MKRATAILEKHCVADNKIKEMSVIVKKTLSSYIPNVSLFDTILNTFKEPYDIRVFKSR